MLHEGHQLLLLHFASQQLLVLSPKYFYILHRFVAREKSPDAQFAAFLNGYLQTFPEEKETVLRIFRLVTGLDYPEALMGGVIVLSLV